MAGKGKPIKLLEPGELLGRKRSNEIITLLNAFLNGEIVAGKSNAILFGDRKIVFQITGGEGAPQSGNSQYRGEYESTGATPLGSGPFATGDVVRVSPTNANAAPAGPIIPGVYVCISDGPSDTDFPNHPLSDGGETIFWQWLATWPSLSNTCDSDGNSITIFADQWPGNAS